MSDMRKIILASGSASRKALLALVRIPFEVYPAQVDERSVKETDFKKRAAAIAELKALWVAERKRGIIVAADTFTVCKGRTLGKPKTIHEAKEILKFLSGKKFMSFTGLYCINTENKKTFSGAAGTEVQFRELSEEDIEDSLAHDPVTEWAAAYNVSQASIGFVKSINGSISGLIYGLPLELLYQALGKIG